MYKCIKQRDNKNCFKKINISCYSRQELSPSLFNAKVIPRLLVSMIKIGEETGQLSFMLENLANFYKREVEEAVTVLTKAMEPMVIFVVAAIVGTIVIALYLPMFDLINQMG